VAGLVDAAEGEDAVLSRFAPNQCIADDEVIVAGGGKLGLLGMVDGQTESLAAVPLFKSV
jgi:hypothetical protein